MLFFFLQSGNGLNPSETGQAILFGELLTNSSLISLNLESDATNNNNDIV